MSKTIKQQELSQVMIEKMMPYSLSVITSRALPELFDGFKPSQRKALYTMSTMHLFNQRAKSANIEGQVMKYNPHAGSYLTMVRLTRQAEAILTPFIEGKGSFGKHYSSEMEPAAPRYSEMQLAPICHELFDNLKKNPENMVDNYDGTLKEPKYLSAPFPNILANPNMGIAVGFACNFPSFNLGEVCDATIATIKNFDKTDKGLLTQIRKVMPTADFTTGCTTLIDDAAIESIYKTGQGPITLRATFNNDEKERVLEVLEIPYSTSIENCIDAIIKAYSAGRLPGVTDVRNEIDKNGFKLAIDYKRGTDVEELKRTLLALTPLQSNFSVNMYLLHAGVPKAMGVLDILRNWIIHRREWVKTELEYDLKEKENLLHLLKGLEAALLDLDKAVKIVRKSKTDAEVISGLKKAFKIDDVQAEFVAEIKLRNFNKDYILNKTKEIKNLEKDIKDLKATLKDGIDNKLITDLQRIKKQYAQPRKTKVVTEWDEIKPVSLAETKKASLEGNAIVFTGPDSVKVVAETSTAKTPDGFTKHEVSNADEVLAFTNLGRVFKYQVGLVPLNANTSIASIKKVAKKLEPGETVIYTTVLKPETNLVIIFDNDKLVKFPLSVYSTEGNKLLFKTGFATKAPVEYIKAIDKDKEINLDKYTKPINTADYTVSATRTAQGVKLKKTKRV